MSMTQIRRQQMGELMISDLNFDINDFDRARILKIVERMVMKWGVAIDPIPLAMDITACHLNGCPLQLQALLEADERDLMHDVLGIRKNLNRETGKLMDCFLPRYAASQK